MSSADCCRVRHDLMLITPPPDWREYSDHYFGTHARLVDHGTRLSAGSRISRSSSNNSSNCCCVSHVMVSHAMHRTRPAADTSLLVIRHTVHDARSRRGASCNQWQCSSPLHATFRRHLTLQPGLRPVGCFACSQSTTVPQSCHRSSFNCALPCNCVLNVLPQPAFPGSPVQLNCMFDLPPTPATHPLHTSCFSVPQRDAATTRNCCIRLYNNGCIHCRDYAAHAVLLHSVRELKEVARVLAL
jgi:hypothetical protein